MPATIADIAAGTRAARIDSVSTPAVQARYPSARDGSAPAAEGLFDNPADAATALAARAVLIGAERRRFKVVAGDLTWVDPLTGMPSAALVDAEQALAATGLISRIEISLDDDATTFEVFL